ncbi:hypothetical protein BOW53_13015 [Solemya pervernicosa gill symbiont]|uniref:EAL domain-containing protein n=1 Tax=Solemya pervernicosa gill symbiont TaxID=642797 RepID=A0A1T2L1U8_9GAMM|nr:hypothetical protein BOW53_13015 [Solemya pervernicosa gill symbiont]
MSIGIASIHDRDQRPQDVMSAADMACYMAKELGRNRIHLYTADDLDLARRHGEMQWVSRIKRALEEESFFLECQPIIPLGDEERPSLRWEMLIRLREEEKVILPGAFIGSAERYGLMPDIDRWVIDTAIELLSTFYHTGQLEPGKLVFFINISGCTISEKSLFKHIKKQLAHHHVPPQAVCFEITETAAISNLTDAVEFMGQLRELGCAVALDDFGAGLCSFTYLKSIPADYLKIDGSFIQHMLEQPMDAAIVEVIKYIGDAASLKTIAEFVTSDKIRIELEAIGINYAQGFGIERPGPLHKMISKVHADKLSD